MDTSIFKYGELPEFKKFTLYAIRHSYARRIIKRGKASVVGSKSMGNDIKIKLMWIKHKSCLKGETKYGHVPHPNEK